MLFCLFCSALAQQQCYFPNGGFSDDVPCTDDRNTHCYSPGSTCLTNGLCLNGGQPYAVAWGSWTDKPRSTGVPSTLPIVCLPLCTDMPAKYVHDEQSPEQAPQPSSSSPKTLPTTPTAVAKSFPAAGRETLSANKDVIHSTFPRATVSTVAPSSRTSPRRMQSPSLTRHPLRRLIEAGRGY